MTPISIMLLAGQGIVGAVVGSAVTTAAMRTARHEGWLRGRSHCDGCGRNLGYLETVPILSYVGVKGRCTSCAAAVSWRHPAGEVAGAVVYMTAVLAEPGAMWLPLAALGAALLYASIFDLETLRIPDSVNVVLAALGLLLAAADHRALAASLTGGAVFLVLTLIRRLYVRLKGRDGLGGGDIKMLSAMGVWLGPERFPLMLTLAAGLALIAALAGRAAAPDRRIAFGPFIACASWAVGLWA